MYERIKEFWFVGLIGIIMLGFVGYFVYDSNKYHVSGQGDVVASIFKESITSQEYYKALSSNEDQLLYNLYKKEVVMQSVKTTDDLKKQAKTLAQNITANAKSQSPEHYKTLIASELATYGFDGYDQLEDYALFSVKNKALNEAYIDEHFDEAKDILTNNKARTVSVIRMAVTNPDALTKEEQEKKDNIDKALSKQSFAKTATAYSDDTATADKKGFYGLISSADATDSTSGLASEVINAALALDKGQTSEWITVTDSQTNAYYLYRVYVNETDANMLHQSKNDTVKSQLVFAVLNGDNRIEAKAIEQKAKKLTIRFNDKDTKKKLQTLIKQQLKGGN